jgi:hypothetical protein
VGDHADIHGQYKFNFRHEHIARDSSKSWLDFAFQRDYDINGPSLFRMMRTMFLGWQRYGRDADPRVRSRFVAESGALRHGYGAALWAMEHYLVANAPVSARIGDLRRQIEREFGVMSRVIDRVAGQVLLWAAPRGHRVSGRPAARTPHLHRAAQLGVVAALSTLKEGPGCRTAVARHRHLPEIRHWPGAGPTTHGNPAGL